MLNKLLSNRSDPRLSKLLHAGDDLSAVVCSETVLSQKRDENIAIILEVVILLNSSTRCHRQ